MAKKTQSTTTQATKAAAASKPDLSKPVVSTEIRNSPIPKAAPAPKKEITYQMIAERAYYISQSGNASSPDDNWLRAEQELRGS